MRRKHPILFARWKHHQRHLSKRPSERRALCTEPCFPVTFFANWTVCSASFQRYSGPATSIRGFGRGGFPALNVGTTPESIEIYAFRAGLDPATVDVTIDRGVLTLSGERKRDCQRDGNKSAGISTKGFAGSFRRVVSPLGRRRWRTARGDLQRRVLAISIKPHRRPEPSYQHSVIS